MIVQAEGGIIVSCRVQPSASKNSYSGIHDNAFKFSLAAPPVDGKANKTLCVFLAKQLKVPKSSVKIHNGEKSRIKKVFCRNVTKEEFYSQFPMEQ